METFNFILKVIGFIGFLIIIICYARFILNKGIISFFKVSLLWLTFFAIAVFLSFILGEAFKYIAGLGGFACLIYAISFVRAPGDDKITNKKA
jgi:hypothetical protein